MMITVLIAAVLGASALVTTARADCGPCCLCGPPISVNLTIKNTVAAPFFTYSIKPLMGQRQLIYFLESAADMQREFRFSADYSGSLGYLIKTINGRSADAAAGTTWMVRDGNNYLLNKGVSSYVPSHNETIIFNFAKV